MSKATVKTLHKFSTRKAQQKDAWQMAEHLSSPSSWEIVFKMRLTVPAQTGLA